MHSTGLESNRIPRNVDGCYNLGYCGLGCPVNAKQSMLITKVPDALDSGAALLHDFYVDRLVWKGDRVQGLVGQANKGPGRAFGKELSIRAKHIVLSAGAIGSPGILLRSKVPNPSGRLGSATTLHPVIVSGALMPELVAGLVGLLNQCIQIPILRKGISMTFQGSSLK